MSRLGTYLIFGGRLFSRCYFFFIFGRCGYFSVCFIVGFVNHYIFVMYPKALKTKNLCKQFIKWHFWKSIDGGQVYFRKQVCFLLCPLCNICGISKEIFKSLSNKPVKDYFMSRDKRIMYIIHPYLNISCSCFWRGHCIYIVLSNTNNF